MTFTTMTRRAMIAAALATTALATGGLADAAQARELRMGLITPPAHVWTQVANRMAEAIVDAFEEIDVRNDHADGALLVSGALNLAGQHLHQETPVVQSRQRVRN